ncbi:hypothetical protein N7475_005484 [Penicillium sp. IBT 31633x]|nr:hypothetical protein N7475_005484 [Penicillium sp. IBT 31633x]
MVPKFRYQASVFVNGRGTIADPHDDMPEFCWVTAHLPEDMSRGGQSDEEIMNLVLCKIQTGQVVIGNKSLGFNCLSLPVKGIPQKDADDVLTYVEVLTVWWLQQIRLGEACLDQYSLFEASTRSPEHIQSLENVPHGECPID